MAITNKQKAIIHIAKAQTGMDDTAYLALLADFGVKSSKDLSDDDFEKLILHFTSLGFKSTSKARKSSKVRSNKDGQATISNKQKSLLHVAKVQTGMSDDAYRDLLATYGVKSSTDLASDDFEDILNHFKSLGFKSTSRFRRPPESKKPLMSKVYALKSDMGLSDAYIDAMVKRMFKNEDGEPMLSFLWLNHDQLRRLVAALSRHQRRIMAKNNNQNAKENK